MTASQKLIREHNEVTRKVNEILVRVVKAVDIETRTIPRDWGAVGSLEAVLTDLSAAAFHLGILDDDEISEFEARS